MVVIGTTDGTGRLRSRGDMSLSLARARAFNAVFETGSISQAARRLGLAQPTVSQQVGDLERDYGVALFLRRGVALVPSDLGRSLYAATRAMRSAEAEALAILEARRDTEAGELVIGLGNAMPGMRVVADFLGRMPQIRVRVEMGSWATILQAVVERRVDVAILPEVPEDGRFRRRACLHQRVVALTTGADAFGDRGEVSCRDLVDRPLVFRTRDSATQRIVDRAFRRLGLSPTPRLVVDTRDGVIEAVAAGLGVGFVWENGTSRSDGLALVPVREMSETFPEFVFALADRRDRLVDLFVEMTDHERIET